jgi:hypothetical protein
MRACGWRGCRAGATDFLEESPQTPYSIARSFTRKY